MAYKNLLHSAPSGNELCIGVKAERWKYLGLECVTYKFYTGSQESQVRISQLVSVFRAPAFWKEELEKHHGNNTETARYMGRISYGHSMPIPNCSYAAAEVFEYYPKEGLSKGMAYGLPYFLESITTKNEENLGKTHIQTRTPQSIFRIKQLHRIGLAVGNDVAINYWIKSLLRGVHQVTGTDQLLSNILADL